MKRIMSFCVAILLTLSFAGIANANEISFQKPEDLDVAGIKLGLMQGASSMYVAEEYFKKADLVYCGSTSEGYTGVEYGKLDGVIFDGHALDYAAAVNENFTVIPGQIGEVDIVIGSSFGKEELVAKTNEFIKNYKSDGTFEDMYDRWILGNDTKMPELPSAQNPTETIHIGTEGINEPMNYYGEGGELIGFDIEFAKRLGYFLGVEVKIETMPFNSIVGAAETGKIDLMIANLNKQPEMMEKMLLTDSYLRSGIKIMIKKERLSIAPPEAAKTDVSPLKSLEGKKIGAMSGSTGEIFITDNCKEAEPKRFDAIGDAMVALSAEKVDYVITAYTTAINYEKNDKNLEIVNKNLVDEFSAIAFSKSKTQLLADVNAQLLELKENGQLDDMISRWIENDGSDYKKKTVDMPADGKILKVGIAADREPVCFVQDGEMVGLDCELIETIAAKLGMKVEYSNMKFSSLIAALESTKVDVVISNVSITEERKERINFSESYFTNPQVLVAKKGTEAAKAQKVETSTYGFMDGKIVGVVSGTIAEKIAADKLPNSQVAYYNNFADLLVALESNKIFAYMVESPMAEQAVSQSNKVDYIKEPIDISKSAVAFPKTPDGDKLREQYNEYLAKIIADGSFEKIHSKWHTGPDKDKVMEDFSKLPATNGILNIGTNSTMAPYTFIDNGKNVGCEIELMAEFCKENAYGLNIKDLDFGSLIPALGSGNIHAAAACITITPERAQSVNFSESNEESGYVLVMNKGDIPTPDIAISKPRYNNAEELTGKKMGVPTGSAYDKITKDNIKDAEILYFNNITDQITALQNGTIDAFITDEPLAKEMKQATSGITYLMPPLLKDDYAFMLPKSKEKLRDDLSAFIKEYRENGKLIKLQEKWLSPDTEKGMDDYSAYPATNGTIKVVSYAALPPFAYVLDNKIVGYDIEIIADFCKKNGYAMVVDDVNMAGLLTAVSAGKYDLAACCITVTDERKETMCFTDSTYSGGPVIVVMEDTNTPVTPADTSVVPKYQKLTELVGKNVLSLTGTIFFESLDKIVTDYEKMYMDDMASMFESVKSGKAEAVLLDKPVAILVAAQNPELTIMPEYMQSVDPYGIALKKGSPYFEDFDRIIKEMKADGTLAQLEEKWFSGDKDKMKLQELDFSKAEGTLVATIDPLMLPMVSLDENSKPMGYEVEVAMLIAHKMGKNIDFIISKFASIIPSLESGKADMGFSCVSITPERMEAVDFPESHYMGGQVAIVQNTAYVKPTTGIKAFFDSIALSFEKNFIRESRWKLILEGTGVTVFISLAAAILGTILGFLVCLMRRAKYWLVNGIAKVFIRIIQGTPVVVFLMILYYIVFGSITIDAIWVAVIGFAINFAAYVSEMIRTGIDAVDKGQIEAANAMGFSKVKTFIKIVFPQAARHFLPVYKGEFISMVKMTSVAGYIAIQDLTKMSDIIRSRTYEAFFPLIATAIIYFIIAYIMTLFLNLIEIKIDPKRRKRVVRGVKTSD